MLFKYSAPGRENRVGSRPLSFPGVYNNNKPKGIRVGENQLKGIKVC